MITPWQQFWARLTRYEYWSWWFFYLPLLPYGLWLALRARSLTFFAAANPGIKYGGLFGESKQSILDKVDPKWLPNALFVPRGLPWPTLQEQFAQQAFSFPVIAKPDVGERGTGVTKIANQEALAAYQAAAPGDFIIQEFVEYPLELGVLWYRWPGEATVRVTSVTTKTFLTVTGDGRATVQQLMTQNLRASLQLPRLAQAQPELLAQIPQPGETLLLEPIGNHCRGTRFENGNAWIDERWHAAFSQLAGNLTGIYYGRFDLKTRSVADLLAGQHVRVLELNGVASEPAHIYQPGYGLWRAYRDVAAHWKIIFRIAQRNRAGGIQLPGWQSVGRALWQYFRPTANPPN